MPRDVSLSDSKCWNGGQKLVKKDLIKRNAPMQRQFLDALLIALPRHRVDAALYPQAGVGHALGGFDDLRAPLHRKVIL